MPGFLRGWRCVWVGLWCLAPQVVTAQVPPPGFGAALFIDADGCVRERAGGDWRPRLLNDGTPDCGYPPTPFAPPPPRDAGLPLPPGMPEAEGRLLTIMAEGLRPGDLEPPVPSPPPPALPRHPVRRAIESALSPDGLAARSALAGARPNARLCDLIGEAGGGAASGPGGDPSRGFCPGDAPGLAAAALRPAAVLPVKLEPAPSHKDAAVPTARNDHPPVARTAAAAPPVAASRSAPSPKPAAPPDAARATTSTPVAKAPAATPAAPAAPRTTSAAAAAPATTVPAVPAAKAGAAAPAPVPRREAVVDERLIPAGSRFLQLGGPVDAAGADARIARIAALGLPVARGKVQGGDGVLVMAGPFDSRQAIVRAYARLRTAGFANISAW